MGTPVSASNDLRVSLDQDIRSIVDLTWTVWNELMAGSHFLGGSARAMITYGIANAMIDHRRGAGLTDEQAIVMMTGNLLVCLLVLTITLLRTTLFDFSDERPEGMKDEHSGLLWKEAIQETALL